MTVISIVATLGAPPITFFARTMSPAQVPKTGNPFSMRSRSGERISRSLSSLPMTVLSPPGMIRASNGLSRSAFCLISKWSTPSPSRERSCSMNAPWRARIATITTTYCPLSAMIVLISSALMPTIAWPRSVETSARSFESV